MYSEGGPLPEVIQRTRRVQINGAPPRKTRKRAEMSARRSLWDTRPKTNRLAYYSFLARSGLGRRPTDIRKDVVVEYDGMKFLLPKGFTEVVYSIYLDEYEPETCRYMTSQSGDVFVDVGANVGGYTVRLGKKFRRVLAVEPNPKASETLRRNIELNGLSNVVVIDAAVSDKVGDATMYVPSSGKTTRSSIIEKFKEGRSFTVQTTTLDALLDGYERIDLLKVDAEGAEIDVLRGADRTLWKTSKLILELGSWSEAKTMEFLGSYDFKVSNLDIKVATGRNVLAERTVNAQGVGSADY
jgi:FkbM family methyltransferase